MKKLEIYFTSDIHGYIYPTDYTDNNIKSMGLLALDSSIHKTENTLIIDGGDTIQGSPYCAYYAQHLPSTNVNDTNMNLASVPHPVAEIMNKIGYDYITLGNHDFNYGDYYIRKYMRDSQAMCLCANIKDQKDDDKLIKGFDIRTMPNGLRVGIIGIVTDYINVWERKEHLKNYEITDPFIAAKSLIETLKGKTDLIIGIYHGGFEADIYSHKVYSKTTENIGYQLSKELDFDVLLTGHQHMAIAGHTLHGTHIVQTPSNGRMYARIIITTSSQSSTTQQSIKSITSQLITPKTLDDCNLNHCDQASETMNSIQDKVQDWLDMPVGRLDTSLTPDDRISMACNGTPIANFLNQAQLATTDADISCTSLGNRVKGLGTEVSLRDIVSTYVFPNTLIVIQVSGLQLKKALERCAEYFEYAQTSTSPLGETLQISEAFLKPKVEHYNYDYFSGIDYTLDISKPIGSRVISVKFRGKEIKNTDTFKLVMNNYRATGTGGYDMYMDCKVLLDLQTTTADMVAAYIRKHSTVNVDQTKYLKVLY